MDHKFLLQRRGNINTFCIDIAFSDGGRYADLKIKLTSDNDQIPVGLDMKAYKVFTVPDENKNLTYERKFDGCEGMVGDGYKWDEEGIKKLVEMSTKFSDWCILSNTAVDHEVLANEYGEVNFNGLEEGLWFFDSTVLRINGYDIQRKPFWILVDEKSSNKLSEITIPVIITRIT